MSQTAPAAEPEVATAAPPPKAAQPPEEPPRLGLLRLCGLALGVGVVGGFGAVVFRDLIGLVHNLLFTGRLALAYDSSLFTPPPPWGVFVILVPVIGGMGVTWLVTTFAPEAKGHGVPEVMDAIYYNRGVIRPVVAVVKSLASALSIGSGAAVGREGPIIQIGSAFGSTLGQIVPMPSSERITLVAAGAGAGIAATFNTPIGGVLFATELMLPEISANTFMPVAIATGTATVIGRIFFGDAPAFSVPADLAVMPPAAGAGIALLLLYALLGAIIAVAATGFIRGLHWAEDAFDLIRNPYLRHGGGMLLVGILLYALLRFGGHYYVEGVGYATIQATLNGQLTAPAFLVLLYVCKLAATTTSLGSGSSGGIFSPSLFMGATLGAAFAGAVGAVLPGLAVNPAAFAMIGMGAMVGSGTGAAMTAVTMIFEMTRDYDIVLPLILSVAVALGVRRRLSRENIYTMKLVRRGHAIPKALHANMFLVRKAADVMARDVLVLDEATTFAAFLQMAAAVGGLRHVIVTRDGDIVGALRVNTDLRRAIGAAGSDVRLGELVGSRFVTVPGSAAMFDVIATMWRSGATMAVVVGPKPDGGRRPVVGVVTKEHVADAVAASIRLYLPG